MDHAQLVMACRFGWTVGPDNDQQLPMQSSPPVSVPLTTSLNNFKNQRFVPCRGRLYHQLACSHRIRTDVVEDCGPNCLEPFNNASAIPFCCHECIEKQVQDIWNQRELEHNASYPPIGQMTTEQYEQWYQDRRWLEAQFTKDRAVYELELKAISRPSNVCSSVEVSKEETEFAAELDSLCLALVPSNDDSIAQPRAAIRTALPTDASERLHWGLNALSLDRGSCGVEASQDTLRSPTIKELDEEGLWGRPEFSRNPN
jgi:hypothetical protein